MQGQVGNFVPSNNQKEAIQRNYVFVDEHNRHKRLKVMRACEGCRRRKIKCDSATTNIWPCAACVRLKLQCIHPNINDESDSEPSILGGHMDQQRGGDLNQAQLGMPDFQQYVEQFDTVQSPQHSFQASYHENPTYHQTTYVEPPVNLPAPASYGGSQVPQASVLKSSEVHSPYQNDIRTASPPMNVNNLTDAFGDLQIDVNGTSPYIADQARLANTHAVQEYDIELPRTEISTDMRIRIPDEMMPTDTQALEHFDYFFTHIHQFVPVLCQSDFYQSWNTDRDSLSPLLLEAVFACTTAMMGQELESNKWIALAKKHEDYYKDSPRLATVQALVLLLKAREAHPRRGYFYRSWTSVVNAIALAKDLDLGQHLETHETNSCRFDPVECVCRTRIWQALFILEGMIGGPQGRLDFNIRPDTVDFSEPPNIPGIDNQERRVSCHFIYFLRLLNDVRNTLEAYRDAKKKGVGWGLQPGYVALDNSYNNWFSSLPPDFQISIPETGHEPWLASTFAGNMHVYGYLSIITHHRPQVHYLMSQGDSDAWKPYMLTCLHAAKKMCRIHESMFRTLGLPGFACMLRGISFTIYATLTCAMIHLAAVTAPDPDISYDAQDYFVRSMRLLEKFSLLWPMDVIRKQIDSLREAFSADINKPFELKSGFPFSSPTPQPLDPPVVTSSPLTQPQLRASPISQLQQLGHSIHEPRPPTAFVPADMLQASSLPHHHITPYPLSANSPAAVHSQTQPWNPVPIFEKWHGAFYATPPPPTEQGSPASSHLTSPTEIELPPQTFTQTSYPAQTYTSDTGQIPVSSQMPQLPQQWTFPNYNMDFFAPSTWQDVVANSCGLRSKRAWNAANQDSSLNQHLRQ